MGAAQEDKNDIKSKKTPKRQQVAMGREIIAQGNIKLDLYCFQRAAVNVAHWARTH